MGSASVTCRNAFSAEQEQRPSCSQEGVGGEETEAIGGHSSFYTFGRKREKIGCCSKGHQGWVDVISKKGGLSWLEPRGGSWTRIGGRWSQRADRRES